MSSNPFWFSNNGVELLSIHPINGITINNTSDNALNILGGLSVSNGITIGGTLTVSGSLTNTGTSGQTLTNLTITDTTISSNYSTGTLVSYGGITINNTSNPIGLGSGGTLLSRGGASFDKDLFVGGVVNTISLSSSNVLTVNLTTSSLVTSNISSSSVSVIDTISTNICSGNVNTVSLTCSNSVITDQSSTNITTVSLISNNLSSDSLFVTNLNGTNISSGTINITELTGSSALITDINVTNISAVSANLVGLTTSSAFVTNMNATNLTTTSLNTSNITTVSLICTDLTVGNGLLTDLNSTNICSGNVISNFLSVYESSSVGSIITTGGNVGISTTAPSRNLHVNGDALFSNLTTGNINFTGTLYNNGIPFTGSTSASQWSTSGSNIFFSGGNVGIGTSNPAQRLVVSGTPISNAVEIQVFNDSFTSANLTLGVPSQAGNIITNSITGGSVICNDFGPLQLGARNSAGSATGYLLIRTGGNIGISTTTPSKSLHVNGDTLVSGLTVGSIFASGIRGTSSTIANLKVTRATCGNLNINSWSDSLIEGFTFYSDSQGIAAAATGTYYITIPFDCMGKLCVNIVLDTNTSGAVWAAHGNLIAPIGTIDQLRPNLSNIIEFEHNTINISATLAPFAGANSTATVTDSPANSVRVTISSLSGPATIYWTLIAFRNSSF